MLEQLEAAAARLEREDAVRVVLLTGEGEKAFCAGADIADWGALDPLAFGRRWVWEGHRIFDRWARLRQPVIAALNGIAFGGGLELAATADLRVAEEHARVALPETRIGIVPGWSGTQRLVRRAGPSAVKRLIFTGEPIDAAEALRLGLVDYLCPKGQGLARARELAATIVERAPVAVQIGKQLVNVAEGEEGAAAWKPWPVPSPPPPRMQGKAWPPSARSVRQPIGAGSAVREINPQGVAATSMVLTMLDRGPNSSATSLAACGRRAGECRLLQLGQGESGC